METTKAIQDRTETTAAKLAAKPSEMENNQLESEKENNQPKNSNDPSGLATIHDHHDEKKETEKDHSGTNDNKDSGLNKLESETENGNNGVGSSTVGVVGAGASPDPAVEKPESKSMPVKVPDPDPAVEKPESKSMPEKVPDPAVEKPESKSMPVNVVEPEATPAPAKPSKRKSEPKAKAAASPKVVATPKRRGRAPKAKSNPTSKAKAKVRVTGRSFRCHVTVTVQWVSNFVEVVFSYLSDLSVCFFMSMMMVLLQCNNTQ